MQETYNSFKRQSDLLYDHNKKRNEARKSYDTLVDQQKHIRDRPDDMPVLDKIKLKRIKISLETWENVCELVESIIQDGQVTCKKRWFPTETLLYFLDLHYWIQLNILCL